ncbi:polysaccharide deacetylase family protein [Salinimicrobium sp. WS361]|uniref:polysaccharide deacetylase family protein n=1 Tax=Salinimicrobium sp. WS361 TaxID=3425123 RepID=UPI003D6F4F52
MKQFSLILILLFLSVTASSQEVTDRYGALVRSGVSEANIYLIFTGHEHYEGFEHVLEVLKKQEIEASFFLTGDFIRQHRELVKEIAAAGHFVGAHSDRHLLYNDWTKRDSLLYSPATIKKDIIDNLKELEAIDIYPEAFMPPYEWYNQKVVEIATEAGQRTINFSPGIRTNADYTSPDMANYLSSEEILKNLYHYEQENGLKGFHILIHPGTTPLRKDKLYLYLDSIINELKERGYHFLRFR